MSYGRKTLIEELHKFARLIRGGQFDPTSGNVAAILSVAAATLAEDGRNSRVTNIALPARGGPTEDHPDAPYCKLDQSCCDFVCGN